MSIVREKVTIIGSGNWGSVIAKIIGNNVRKYPAVFQESVNMYVFEELVQGKKLTEIINETQENVKYLPNVKLPSNIYAEPDLLKSVKDSSLLIFVLPHQFIDGTLKTLKGNIKSDAKAISLIKGVDVRKGGLDLISHVISRELEVDTSVLMGANIASEIAKEEFSESTLGYKNKDNAELFKLLLETPYFKISTINDIAGVELCGALKNVVAIAAGICDGLNAGQNTKAAVIRIGLMEMKKFARLFYDGVRDETFFESCGIADLIATCQGGRNRKIAEAHAFTGKSFAELEETMLNGQKLQGTLTAMEVHQILEKKDLVDQFPLFNSVYEVVFKDVKCSQLLHKL
ncbi:hypothetical protein HK099_004938 [Clydaea vesicula]|uniref:Glycerol-3-phosphate dehydrogenase [NAD(+)] n=1 Tax=Clydaea vesicula TaxID=447962 RepID=A0AAD5TZW8_9FUNG|nr:hypothetical protein HK099_004938 [Clydaea vesicula]KAJ3392640.1 hypothetical protein HDU92_008274 [Lobulomyces angularis]